MGSFFAINMVFVPAHLTHHLIPTNNANVKVPSVTVCLVQEHSTGTFLVQLFTTILQDSE